MKGEMLLYPATVYKAAAVASHSSAVEALFNKRRYADQDYLKHKCATQRKLHYDADAGFTIKKYTI